MSGKHPMRGQAVDFDVAHVLIYPNGTGAPTHKASGRVASVTRLGNGDFRVTLDRKPAAYLGVQATFCTDVTTEDIYAQVGTLSVANRTVDVRLKTGTSTVNVTADQDKFIAVAIHLEDSTIGAING